MVTVTASGQPGSGQTRTIVAVPHLRFGGEGDALTAFGGAGYVTMTVGPDRSFFVGDIRGSRVLRFDSTGRFLHLVGRSGSGPGEYRAVGEMGWLADTLWIQQFFQRMHSLFRVDGSFVRDVPYGLRRLGGTGLPSAPPIAMLPRGMDLYVAGEGSVQGGYASFAIVRCGGSPHCDTLATFPRSRAYVDLPSSPRPLTIPNPFSDVPVAAVVPGGTDIVLLHRPVATSAQGTFTLSRFDGMTMRRLSVNTYTYSATRLTSRAIDSASRAVVEPFAAVATSVRRFGSDLAMANLVTQNSPAPAFRPHLSTLLVSRDGSVWVRRWLSNEWLAFAVGGELLGSLTLPDRFNLMHVERDYAWGFSVDDDDVPWITTFRLQAPR